MTEQATETDQESSDSEEIVGEPADSERTTADDESEDKSGLSLTEDAKLTGYLVWGTVAVLFVLAVVATAGLYSSVGRVIDIWIAPDYQPLFRAGFNLAVVLACAIGLSVLVRRLNVSGGN